MNAHARRLSAALEASDDVFVAMARWGRLLAGILPAGGRLLVAGNGGSAAQAQHLTAEIVGRYVDEREPMSALSLHADASAVTAIANDYGVEEMFARQVRGHGRPGDVCLLMSTSGRSANLLAAGRAARTAGLHVWAMCGPRPNPLAALADESVCIPAPDTATVQEIHLVAVHVLCEELDAALIRVDAAAAAAAVPAPAVPSAAAS